jgi:hypothetical protein
MTHYDLTLVLYIYKGHWEDIWLLSSYFVFLTINSETRIVVAFPPLFLLATLACWKGFTSIWEIFISSRDLLKPSTWSTIHLGFISTLIRSCLVNALLNQTCSHWAQGPVKPWQPQGRLSYEMSFFLWDLLTARGKHGDGKWMLVILVIL